MDLNTVSLQSPFPQYLQATEVIIAESVLDTFGSSDRAVPNMLLICLKQTIIVKSGTCAPLFNCDNIFLC